MDMDHEFLSSREEILRDVLSHDPSDASAHAFLGYLLLRQGRRKEALSEARRAIMLAPDLSAGHYVLSLSLGRMGHGSAIRAIEEAIRLDPEVPHYYSRLAYLYLVSPVRRFHPRYLAAALRAAESGLRLGPSDPLCLTYRAACLSKLGDRALANTVFEKALICASYSEQESYVHEIYSNDLIRLGNFTEAVKHLKMAHASGSSRRDLKLSIWILESIVKIMGLLRKVSRGTKAGPDRVG